MLISDPDYLIHTLRLTYLRNLDDPFGPRIITLNPQYASNPYVHAAGLADKEAWPELNMPSSPQPSTEETLGSHSFHGFSPLGDSPSTSRNRHLPQPAEPAGVYPGATGLKYTQTIVGPGRGVGAGMRVSGRRSSTTKAASLASIDSKLQRIRSDSAPTPVTKPVPPTISVQEEIDSPDEASAVVPVSKRRSSGSSTVDPHGPAVADGDTRSQTPANGGEDPSRPALPPFALRFARGAEMEARRRERMKARLNGAQARAAAAAAGPSGLSLQSPEENLQVEAPARVRHESSESAIAESSDEEPGRPETGAEDDPEAADGDESSEEDDDDVMDNDIDGAAIVDDDEFEGDEFLSPPYPLPTIMGTTAGSDDASMLSSGLSVSHSSAFGSSFHMIHSVRNRHRLSPVSEAHGERKDGADPKTSGHAQGEPPDATSSAKGPVAPSVKRANRSYFSISPPEPIHQRPSVSAFSTTTTSESSQLEPVSAANAAPPHARSPASAAATSGLEPALPQAPIFTKVPVKKPPLKSSLTAMLSAKTSVSDNPFTTLYAAISGRAETSSLTLRVYFPFCRTASRKPVELKVRKDATVEEVIGFGLWTYWEQGLEPKLDEDIVGEDDPKRSTKLTAVGWNLRIAEDDGEVDEDFPALDRTRPISKFSFDDFAICPATATQIEQNRAVEAKIVRRPSRTMIAKKPRPDVQTSTTSSTLAPAAVGPISSSARTHSDVLTSATLMGGPSQSGVMVSQGPPVFLRVRVATTADMHYSTTINATSEEYMADVLEKVCRKRRIDAPKEWALLTGDMRIVIPSDRTVASLAGKSDLVLVNKALLDQLGLSKDKRLGRSSDPNASIFKRMSEVPVPAMDFTAAYKRFTVYRKIPMLVGRNERALAIDGDYIHIMPSANRGLLDSVKTSSYHIKSVVYCKQSKKAPASLKLIVWRDGGNKTYDFEAEDPKKAAEIVSSIKNLQKSYTLERSGTAKQVGKSRRVAT